MARDKTRKNLQHDYRPEEQQEMDTKNERSTLSLVLDYAKRQRLGTVGLVQLVNEMGLDTELDALVVSSPERHRAIDLVRRELGLGSVADDAILDADGR